MEVWPYLFTLNKNSGYTLDEQEMKDVHQDVTVYLSTKDYNDLLQKKTIFKYYTRTVKRKARAQQEHLAAGRENAYLNAVDEENPGDAEELSRLEENRLQALDHLVFKSEVQKKIMKLLILGKDYSEVKKKLRMNQAQLANHIYRIKQQNAGAKVQDHR